MIIKFLQSPDAENEPVRFPSASVCTTEGIEARGETTKGISASEPGHILAAHLVESDYWLARSTMPELAVFEDYRDWLDHRTGVFWGLEMAGYTVELTTVDLGEFSAWLQNESMSASLSALDRFARIHHLWTAGGQYEQEALPLHF